MKKIIFIICIMIQSSLAYGKMELKEITLCYEDIDLFPWFETSGDGLVNLQIKIIEEKTKIKMILVPFPWKRCMQKVKMGEIDGALSSSYTLERASWSQFPYKANGELERDYRLNSDSYLVYVNKASSIKWKNKKFENLGTNPVGAQLGYSSYDELTRMNIPVYTSFSDTKELLRSVSNNLTKVAVLQKDSTNKYLKENPDIAKNIIVMDEPFMLIDQYINFNKFFYTKNRVSAEKIWKASRDSRKDVRYLKKYQLLIK